MRRLRVFRWGLAEGYLGLVPVHASDYDLLDRVCKGVPLRDKWYPIEMEFNHEFDTPVKKDKLGDLVSSFATRQMLGKRSVEGLAPLLERHGELLPLSCAEGEYYIFNPLTVVDAIDFEKSRVQRLPSGAILDMGNRYYFKGNLIEDVSIFMAPQLPGRIFVTDLFVRLVDEKELSGFQFPLVWDSETQTL